MKGNRYTYTYLHENDIYLHVGINFFYFFSLFFRGGERCGYKLQQLTQSYR